MITIAKDSAPHYCNSCLERLGVVMLDVHEVGHKLSTIIYLCRQCLAELADVANQADQALESTAPEGETK